MENVQNAIKRLQTEELTYETRQAIFDFVIEQLKDIKLDEIEYERRHKKDQGDWEGYNEDLIF